MNFLKEKEQTLKKHDLSRKGSIDCHIYDLVQSINSLHCFFTCSSCSGRTIVFTNSKSGKKGCQWLFVTHDLVKAEDIIKSLESHSGSALLKFEPFVLHTQCSSLEDAKNFLKMGVQAGFKNSGISIGKCGRIIVAIRSTLCLEVPLSNEGSLLVTEKYISHVVDICNEKMLTNWKRIERFYIGLQKGFNLSDVCCTDQDSNVKSIDNDKDQQFACLTNIVCEEISSSFDENKLL